MTAANMVRKQVAQLAVKMRAVDDVEDLLRARNALIDLCKQNGVVVSAEEEECPPGFPGCKEPTNPPPGP